MIESNLIARLTKPAGYCHLIERRGYSESSAPRICPRMRGRASSLNFKMPNFTASNLVKAQTGLKAAFAKNEQREKAFPALTLALRNSNILTPGTAEQLRTRDDRQVEAYILKRNKRNTTHVRTHNHTGNRGDSMAVPLTWQPYVDTFSISLKQMDNNVFSFEQALQNLFADAIMNIRRDIEIDNMAYLMAQRTQVNAATAGGEWNAVNHAFEIPAEYKDRYFQMGQSIMMENDYRGKYDVITSPTLALAAEYYAAQGSSNAVNTSYQFPNLTIAPSTDLNDPDYPGGVGLWMPAGGFAVLPWIPKQNRKGHGDYNSVLGGYGSISDGDIMTANENPNVLEYAVHGYTQRADTSTQNGDTQDDEMQFEVSVDIARVLSPLSTPNESVVYEIAQLV